MEEQRKRNQRDREKRMHRTTREGESEEREDRKQEEDIGKSSERKKIIRGANMKENSKIL